ncbi:MAG: hypothetical protein A3K67_06085 [Euryarchaeota archaeon RBG_16_62_10]|nr:MAG: hypothetical protein A3K67_06085 [Euryarchaeota archaeon RBG_16_62_10]
MFLRILGKSFSRRKGKMAIAIIAVMMGASVTSALLTVSLDINEKMNIEFRRFGANLLVIPSSDTINIGIGAFGFGAVTEQKYINESDLYKIKTIYWAKNVLGYAPFLYQVVTVDTGSQEQAVVLTGTWFEKPTVLEDGTAFPTGVKKINTWWEVEGSWPDDENDTAGALIGANVADKMGLQVGDPMTVRYSQLPDDPSNETSVGLSVKGIVSGGGPEDDQIFVTLDTAQELTGRHGKVHTVQVSALCTACPVEEFAAEIQEKIPYVEARTVKQLASAEMAVLSKIEGMMLLISVVALVASALGVAAVMTTSVIERRKEIGLMKSMGAENKRIASLFLTEAAILGVVGGLLGYAVGLVLSYFIGMTVFDALVSPSIIVIPMIVGISLGVSLMASSLPVRRATRIEPVVVLRGD